MNHSLVSSQWQPSAAWASLFIPGLGQFLLGRRWRGLVIFLVAPILAYIVNWSIYPFGIAALKIGETTTSWLWLALILFWAWNVLDARSLVMGKPYFTLAGVFFAALILYVVAWNVTDVRLNRLVDRIGDVRTVLGNIANPDLLTIKVDGEEKICDWACVARLVSDAVSGRPAAGPVRLSDNLKDIFGQVKEDPAPRWMTDFGLAQKGSYPIHFVPGTLIETIAMGLLATLFSTLLAVPVSFLAAHNIMSRVKMGALPVGSWIYYVMRTILNVVRAVDTIVWGLILIVWLGLGSFAGVMALTIHSIAALGKLFSEEIEHIDSGPVEAVTATGGNLLQVIRYAVIPQIVPPFLAYTLLRWDINMRSATVVGFVAGGGIGFFVVETIRMGGYQQYGAALWAVAVVIILVDYLSGRWRENILRDKPSNVGKARPAMGRLKIASYVILALALVVVGMYISEIDLATLFEPAPTFGKLISDFVSVDLSPDLLDKVIREMLTTIFQAMLATTLGAMIALPFSFLGARNLTGQSPATAWIYALVRSIFNILRSIEALLYVAIFVFWVGIGAFAGMLALAVTTFALIGKLFSEAIENIDSGPIEALTATGSNILQVVNYAILPQIVPTFVSYLIYQWDINIRMATIIGFAGGGGIGLTLSTFFGSLQYHKAGTVVLFIVVVVALMDFTSARLRENLV